MKHTRMHNQGFPGHLKSMLLGTVMIFILGTAFGSCSETSNEAEGYVLLGSLVGSFVYFKDSIDTALTTSCGTATANSSGDSSNGGNSSGTTKTFVIDSYYTFSNKETMSMKFDYNPVRQFYSLNPLTTTTTTCATSDNIVCDSTTTSGFTCPTVDNINCGGDKRFSFYNPNTNTTFLAYTGTFDWSDGLYLNLDETAVSDLILKLEFIDQSGTIFRGEVSCTSIDQ